MALTLYIDPQRPEDSSWVEAELQDMAVGYDRKVLSPAEAAQHFGPHLALPILQNNEQKASGRAALMAFLKDYRVFVEEWRLFQSDSCYIRDDGHPC